MLKTGTNIYRLTTGKTEGSFSIPRCLIERPGIGLQYANYFVGSTSIWEDDEVNKKREAVTPWLEENGLGQVELQVPISNKALNEFMQKHPFNGVQFELYSEDMVVKKQLAEFDKVERAFEIVRETNEKRIQATALAIFGMEAYGWSVEKSKAELTSTAMKKPSLVIDKYENPNYEAYFTSALAFYSGIIKENNDISLVVWNDDLQHAIIPLAKGESGLAKLGDYFTNGTLEAKTVIQEVYARFNAKNKVTKQKATSSDESDKDFEIQKLKAQLESLQAGNVTVNEPTVVSNSVFEQVAIEDMDIHALRSEYIKVFGKELPPAQKNNKDWIRKRLTE